MYNRGMVNTQAVYSQLKTVIDSELGVNIVDLGLVYKVKVKSQKSKVKVYILMTLTTPGCPLAGVLDQLVGDAIRDIEEVTDVSIELTFDPPWAQEMMSEEVRAELGFD